MMSRIYLRVFIAEDLHSYGHMRAHAQKNTGDAAPQAPPRRTGSESLITGLFSQCDWCMGFRAALHFQCLAVCAHMDLQVQQPV